MDLRIEYTNVPTGSMGNSTTSINYPQPFVDFDDFHTQRQVPKYATLEEGRNILDGTFINFPTTPVGYGYMSTIMSDENGDFADDIVITRTYTNNYTSPRNHN